MDQHYFKILHIARDPNDPENRISFTLKEGPNIIGTSLSCHISLDLPNIAPKHCKITISKDENDQIENLDAENGVSIASDSNSLEKLEKDVQYTLMPNTSFYLSDEYKCIVEDLNKQNGENRLQSTLMLEENNEEADISDRNNFNDYRVIVQDQIPATVEIPATVLLTGSDEEENGANINQEDQRQLSAENENKTPTQLVEDEIDENEEIHDNTAQLSENEGDQDAFKTPQTKNMAKPHDTIESDKTQVIDQEIPSTLVLPEDEGGENIETYQERLLPSTSPGLLELLSSQKPDKDGYEHNNQPTILLSEEKGSQMHLDFDSDKDHKNLNKSSIINEETGEEQQVQPTVLLEEDQMEEEPQIAQKENNEASPVDNHNSQNINNTEKEQISSTLMIPENEIQGTLPIAVSQEEDEAYHEKEKEATSENNNMGNQEAVDFEQENQPSSKDSPYQLEEVDNNSPKSNNNQAEERREGVNNELEDIRPTMPIYSTNLNEEIEGISTVPIENKEGERSTFQLTLTLEDPEAGLNFQNQHNYENKEIESPVSVNVFEKKPMANENKKRGDMNPFVDISPDSESPKHLTENLQKINNDKHKKTDLRKIDPEIFSDVEIVPSDLVLNEQIKSREKTKKKESKVTEVLDEGDVDVSNHKNLKKGEPNIDKLLDTIVIGDEQRDTPLKKKLSRDDQDLTIPAGRIQESDDSPELKRKNLGKFRIQPVEKPVVTKVRKRHPKQEFKPEKIVEIPREVAVEKKVSPVRVLNIPGVGLVTLGEPSKGSNKVQVSKSLSLEKENEEKERDALREPVRKKTQVVHVVDSSPEEKEEEVSKPFNKRKRRTSKEKEEDRDEEKLEMKKSQTRKKKENTNVEDEDEWEELLKKGRQISEELTEEQPKKKRGRKKKTEENKNEEKKEEEQKKEPKKRGRKKKEQQANNDEKKEEEQKKEPKKRGRKKKMEENKIDEKKEEKIEEEKEKQREREEDKTPARIVKRGRPANKKKEPQEKKEVKVEEKEVTVKAKRGRKKKQEVPEKVKETVASSTIGEDQKSLKRSKSKEIKEMMQEELKKAEKIQRKDSFRRSQTPERDIASSISVGDQKPLRRQKSKEVKEMMQEELKKAEKIQRKGSFSRNQTPETEIEEEKKSKKNRGREPSLPKEAAKEANKRTNSSQEYKANLIKNQEESKNPVNRRGRKKKNIAEKQSLEEYEEAATVPKKLRGQSGKEVKLKKEAPKLDRKKSLEIKEDQTKQKSKGRNRSKEDDTEDFAMVKRNSYQVAFSGFDKENKEVEEDKKALGKLGAKIIEDKGQSFNILVMDNFKRTIKFLIALNTAINIVEYKWVKECIRKGVLLPPGDYLYHDTEAEAKHKFKLEKTLRAARNRQRGFLDGQRVYIPATIKPSFLEVKLLIESADGIVIKTKPNTYKDDLLVILNEFDEKGIESFKEMGFQPYSPELIYSAVLQQKLDLKENKL